MSRCLSVSMIVKKGDKSDSSTNIDNSSYISYLSGYRLQMISVMCMCTEKTMTIAACLSKEN